MITLAFTGGGTGGHIFPGLAVIDELQQLTPFYPIWLGSSGGRDKEFVTSHGVCFYGIPSGKLRRYVSLQNCIDCFKIVAGFFISFFILLKTKPSVLFSKGGFVSVPPCLAAKLLGIPVITHECDFSPGLATRINARFASKILVTYQETTSFFGSAYQSRIEVTGNPVRNCFYKADSTKGREFLQIEKSQLPVIFVQGGSLGAREINNLLLEVLPDLCKQFIVVHQYGSSNINPASKIDLGISKDNYKPYPFIRDEIADVLACSDIVITRSGANTIWECAVVGKPMILIPLDTASSRGDQIENAEYFDSHGAAKILIVQDRTRESFLSCILEIMKSPETLRSMTISAKKIGQDCPAKKIALLLADIVKDIGVEPDRIVI